MYIDAARTHGISLDSTENETRLSIIQLQLRGRVCGMKMLYFVFQVIVVIDAKLESNNELQIGTAGFWALVPAGSIIINRLTHDKISGPADRVNFRK